MVRKPLFKGLNFYFYPPRNVSRLNNLKANISAKYGATIEPQLSTAATYVLVAPRNATAEFWRMIGAAKVNEGCEVLSNEWPSRCIDENRLVDPGPFRLYDPSEAHANGRGDGRKRVQPDESGIREPVSPRKKRNDVGTSETTPSVDGTKKAGRENAYREIQQLPAEKPLKSAAAAASPADAASEAEPDDSPISSPSRSASTSPVLSTETSSNQVLIDTFHDLMVAREAAGQEFSARAYGQALKTLESAKEPILTEDEALQLPHFSKHMAQLVNDIRHGKFPSVVTQYSRQRADTVMLFTTVYGIGPQKARRLYEEGCRTLNDIRDKVDHNGQVSIDHHDDFVERMSRTEVTQHYEKVKKLAAAIDGKLHLLCMGSYRRGKLDCGDIDIVMTKAGAEQRELTARLNQLLELMYKTKLAKYTFTQGPDRWLGATEVVTKWRRMDILLVPWKELGAAMIYYTGDDIFNRRLRLKAKRRGLRLNQNGLFKVNSSGDRELLEAHDERKIFKLLDEPWREPEQRVLH